MKTPDRILVFQTAFLGDVILTIPLIQVLKDRFPSAEIDVVTIPRAAEILSHHPAITAVIPYDKRSSEQGIIGIFTLSRKLMDRSYDIAIVPHRSIRSALIIWLSRSKMRIGFTTNAGRFLFTHRVLYQQGIHEIERNLSLLQPLFNPGKEKILPSLYPSHDDKNVVDKFLAEMKLQSGERCITLAPGSVWKTKRWPMERYSALSTLVKNNGWKVVLIGGPEDKVLCDEIVRQNGDGVINSAGLLSLLQSAELIGRSSLLVSNDSAPMHLGVAMRTPVIAIFGATVPAFGFYPYGERDVVIEITGLSCRPCSIHGGDQCPIKTFDCMVRISPEEVFRKILTLLNQPIVSSKL
jgi:heptosyltransferase-2